jgi:hypothetical protein
VLNNLADFILPIRGLLLPQLSTNFQ